MEIVTLRRMLVAVATMGALTLSLPSVSGAASTFAWGNGETGGLGVEHIGEFASVGWTSEPAPNPLAGVSGIAAGSQFALGLSGGTVYAWGPNSLGELGNGTTTTGHTPAAVPGLGTATAVAAGPVSGYALMENGGVEDWGLNSEGQLGQGSHSGPETCGLACSKVPIPVPGLSGVRAISVGGNHALVLLENGTVEAWGGNAHGQLGDGTTVERDSPVAVAGLSEVVSVAAGKVFSLALLANGEVRAWGGGEAGELGNGTTSDSLTPVAVSGLTGVTAISAGESHALALLSNGEVRSWGANGHGQLGNGTLESVDLPVAVSAIAGATAVAAGWNHSIAIVAGGVEDWGENFEGQLGDGSRSNRKAPVQVICGLKEIEGIAAGRAQSYAWGVSQETCPGLASVTPGEGPGAGGTEVTITGSEFGSVSGVSFGSTPASSFSVDSPTSIKAIAPPGTGTVDVMLTSAKGSSVITPSDHFTYTGLPTVTQVSPTFASAGTEVTITGTNLSTVTAVHFGAAASTVVTLSSSNTLVARAPAGEGLVHVTVTNPNGTSEVSSADEFMYRTLYEFGRCVKVRAGNDPADKGCPELTGSGPYEWFPAAFGAKPLEHRGVQLEPGSMTVETESKLRLKCSGVRGEGQITAYNLITIEELTLTGCAISKLGTCSSSGAASGEVRAHPVSAWLGRAETGGPMVQLEPASGEDLAQMTCGTHSVTVKGSFIGQIGKQGKMLSTEKITATEKKGVPAITALVNRPPAAAGMQVDGGAVQPAGVKLTVTQTNEEAIEIR